METPEHQCRKCGRAFSPEEYFSTLFCPTCGVHLPSQIKPKHWLFQFSPRIYDWFGRQKESNNYNEQWLTSQYSKHIRKDDFVAIWSSGQKAGIYALGRVMTNPAQNPLNVNQEKYYKEKSDIEKFQEKSSVEIKYFRTFLDKPLLQNACVQDPQLLDMQVFMNPQGTNFELSNAQWTKLKELLEQSNQKL